MGEMEYRPGEVARRKGHHEALISSAVYENIQKRLSRPLATARVRKDITDDFPVRGLVNCICRKHMTAARSKGRPKHYAYYFCTNRECELYKKSIPAKLVESGFINLLKKTHLKDEISKVVDVIFERVWKEETKSIEQRENLFIQRARELNEKIEGLTDLARKAKSDKMRDVYEKQIERTALELEREQGKSTGGMDLFVPYRTALNKATLLLKKPYKAWNKMGLEEQHELFFFVFDEKLEYDKKSGYRTADIPTAVRLFEDFVVSNTDCVDSSLTFWNSFALESNRLAEILREEKNSHTESPFILSQETTVWD